MFDPFEPGRKYSVEEYLRLENMSDVKHEYRDGVVYEVGSPPPVPMPQARDVFTKLADRMLSLIGRLDLAVKVVEGPNEHGATILAKRTPDGDVSNREQQFADPSCVILLTSDFSYVPTCHNQFDRYRQNPSVGEILWIFADRPHAQHYVRSTEGGWLITFLESIDKVCVIQSIGVRFRLADVYAAITSPTDSQTI